MQALNDMIEQEKKLFLEYTHYSKVLQRSFENHHSEAFFSPRKIYHLHHRIGETEQLLEMAAAGLVERLEGRSI